MKNHKHYCKVCGCYKSNEKFSGKGHVTHICKSCASLPPEQQAEKIALNRIINLPYYMSKSDLVWLKNRMRDQRPAVKHAATEAYKTRFQK